MSGKLCYEPNTYLAADQHTIHSKSLRQPIFGCSKVPISHLSHSSSSLNRPNNGSKSTSKTVKEQPENNQSEITYPPELDLIKSQHIKERQPPMEDNLKDCETHYRGEE